MPRHHMEYSLMSERVRSATMEATEKRRLSHMLLEERRASGPSSTGVIDYNIGA